MKYLVTILCFAAGFSFSSISSAQESVRSSGPRDLSSINPEFYLPQLDSLVAAALDNSASYAFYLEEKKIKEEEFKIQKKEWFDYVSVGGDVRYGIYDQLYLNQSTNSEAYSQFTNSVQLRYFAGVSAKVPLSAVFNRSQNNRIARFNINKANQEVEDAKQQVASLVIAKYFEILDFYRSLVIKKNQMESSGTQFEKAKKDFIDGKMNFSTYSVTERNFDKALLDYETTKNDLLQAFAIMELLTGTKLKPKEL